MLRLRIIFEKKQKGAGRWTKWHFRLSSFILRNTEEIATKAFFSRKPATFFAKLIFSKHV